MNRILRNRTLLFCGLPGINSYDTDVDIEKYKELRGLFIQDPWDRVKTIFMKDDHGDFHPELLQAVERAQMVGLAGGILGSYVEAKKNLTNYIRTSETNIFATPKEAYKILSTYSVLFGGKGFVKYGIKFAIFGGGFSLLASCVELYRNKVGVIEYVAGGFGIGAIFRASLGIKGMISGGVVGGVLGLIYGIILVGLLKLGKVDGLELKYHQFALKLHRQQAEKKKLESSKKLEEPALKLHELHVEDPLNAITVKEKEKEAPVQT